MTQVRFERALGDVSKAFAHPQAIVDADGLSGPQKIELLRQWETDLRLILVAAEENMTRETPDNTAEMLRAVLRALQQLGVTESEKPAAPTKAGGA